MEMPWFRAIYQRTKRPPTKQMKNPARTLMSRVLAGRWGRLEDIIGLVTFPASIHESFIHGQFYRSTVVGLRHEK